MGICYHCGVEVDQPSRCPHCNLTFCDDHKTQKAHKCLVLNTQLSGVTAKPAATKTIHYIEPEAEPQRPRVVRRKKQRQSFLGSGVSPRKLVLVVLILALSLASIMIINQWEPEPDTPNIGAVFPISAETVMMQEHIIELINKERDNLELLPLVYDNNSIAQRYAEGMLESGEFKHNPSLPRTMGENIDIFTSADGFNATEALDFLIYGQVYDDSDNNWGIRDNIYYETYTMASVGIAFDDETVYLVINFS